MKKTRKLGWKLALLAICAGTYWTFLGPLSRRGLEGHATAALGTRVSIRGSRPSLASRSIQLHGLSVADPGDPSAILLQADAAYLVFDLGRFMQRELVIESGKVRNVRIAPSHPAESGSSHADGCDSRAQGDWAARWHANRAALTTQMATQLQTWLKPFDGEADSFDQATAAIRRRLLAELEKRSRASEDLRKQLEALQATLAVSDPNPLRDASRAAACSDEFAQLTSEWKELRESISGFPGELETELESIQTLKEHVARRIRRDSGDPGISGEALARSLLGKLHGDYAAEVLAWVHFVRTISSLDRANDNRPRAGFGAEIQFMAANRPPFLIRNLDFDCAGSIFGQTVELDGQIRNYSLQPSWLSEPCRIELHSDDSTSLQLVAELDRRTKQPVDQFYVRCVRTDVPATELGDPRLVALKMGPSEVRADGDLRLCGDAVEGTIELRHRLVELVAVEQGDLLRQAGPELAAELAQIEEISSEVSLSGSWEDPDFELQSELGTRLSEAIAQAIQSARRRNVEARLATLNRYCDATTAAIRSELLSRQSTLFAQVESQAARLANVAQNLPQDGGLHRLR
jgi:hypothetical protein